MSGAELEFFKQAIEKIKANNYFEAISILDNIILSSSTAYSISTNCNLNINEWEFFEDISHCEKTVNQKNNCYSGYLALSLLFKLVGNNDRRKIFLQKALKINNTISRIWRDYGETSFQLGNIREAFQQFQEAISINPKDTISFEGLGLCYYYLDEPFKAIPPLKKALEISPENHRIMNDLAFIFSEIGELKDAKEIIGKALELEKDNNIYLDTFASILFLEEQYDESLKIFEKILANSPKDWEVSWDILINVYENLGLHAKAKIIEEKLHIK
ncbi:MAG TPA: tetratricopeptide repeat protein [candidate division Zixibacteria bacterium]|nr:tetratricopeptide repeat protein [candidate division Zixibacteria bacterium]